mmetsp:Transcript_29144/g.93055  ORF Transcript_29144/g.93055 Transcript_29144/m.93055 type:complete len:430 (-) Transcript_29144:565-1854(-)
MKISPSIPSVSTPQCSMTRPQRSHGSGGGGGPRPLALSSALPCIPGRSSVTTARSAARAASRSSSSIVIGGARRITFSCVGFASTPLCRHPLSVSSAAGRGGRQLEARAGDGNRYSPPPPPPRTSLRAMQTSYAVTPPALAGLMTTALRRPRPRTASIRPGASPLSSSRTSMTLLPSRSARSGSLSSTTTPRAARATAEERGLPPKVLPCSPGWMQSITSLLRARAQRASEGAPMLPRLDAEHHVLVGKHGAHGQGPSGDGLAQYEHIGPHPLVVAREHPPRARDPRLHLVRDHEHVVLGAELPGPLEVPRGGNDHPRLPLDGLHDEGRHPPPLLPQHRLQGGGVPKVHLELPRQGWPEVPRGAGVTAHGHGPQRAAVEAPAAAHDEGLPPLDPLPQVAPLAGQLESGLHALGPRVHRQLGAGQGRPGQ